MRVLVLGAYGLIGSEVSRSLLAGGFEVTGLGRSPRHARGLDRRMNWRFANIARLSTPADWAPLIGGVDAVVNAAGALQTGLKDDVAATQDRAMIALIQACEAAGVRKFVQISAPGATPDASTLFMRSKAAADAALAASALDWVLLRPALVIASAAYGGTALVRGLAAFPCVTPLVLADAPVRTVSVREVTAAVERALSGEVSRRTDLTLAEASPRPLYEVVAAFRGWMGLTAAPCLRVPGFFGTMVAACADVLGWLGWRSPLRSTALRVMSEGVSPQPDEPVRPLEETLTRMPATPQDLWFARLWLLKPVIFAVLSLFWLASGLIGLVSLDAATAHLTAAGFSPGVAQIVAAAGSLIDIALGLAVAFRPSARAALIGMIAVSLGYIAGSVLFAPGLWLDPLGPMVKTVPALVLCPVALAILEER